MHNYDLDYRLRAIEVSGINPILEREYQYDPANNITAILNNVDSTKSQVFDYDALHRLTIAEGNYGLLGYTYDAVGNRLSQHHDTGTQLINDTYNYATTSHQLLGISRTVDNQTDATRNFAYDAAGNRISGTAENGSEQTYSYNHANRMNHVAVTGGASGNTTATYSYNPLGQRVTKTINNQTQEIYHYDETGQLLAVTDSTGNTLREYIYLDNQQVAFTSNGNLYYIHNDHLNTPQIVTDQNQQVVWMADYQPFGKLTDNQTNSIELYSRFPGQYVDEETGLYYNYFRDYDPSVGRYIQSDPIGLEGGINTYAYVEGNPLNYADIYGLQRVPNAWNRYQQSHAGSGANRTQLSQQYRRDQLSNMIGPRNPDLNWWLNQLPDNSAIYLQGSSGGTNSVIFGYQPPWIDFLICTCFDPASESYCTIPNGAQVSGDPRNDPNCSCYSKRYVNIIGK